jgi:hypothetical protein
MGAGQAAAPVLVASAAHMYVLPTYLTTAALLHSHAALSTVHAGSMLLIGRRNADEEHAACMHSGGISPFSAAPCITTL